MAPDWGHREWQQNQDAQKEAKQAKKKIRKTPPPPPDDEKKNTEGPRDFDPVMGF